MAKGKKVMVELVKDCDAGKAGAVVALAAGDADKLIASGDAKAAGDGTTEVALLADCHAGKAGAVIAVSDDDAAMLVDGGFADDSDAAVAHRKSVHAAAAEGSEKALEG